MDTYSGVSLDGIAKTFFKRRCLISHGFLVKLSRSE